MRTASVLPHHLSVSNPFHSFGDTASAPLVGRLRNSVLPFIRAGFGQHHANIHVSIDRRDAFYVIFSMQDHSAHEHYWVNGRAQPAPASPRGSVHIYNMNDALSGLLHDDFDSLNLVLSRELLDELAEDVGAPPVNELVVPDAWRTQDPVMAMLGPILVGALTDRTAVSSYFMDHLTTSVALHLAERYGGLRRAVLLPGALAPWQEKRAREMIAVNLTKELSLAEVATECRLSLSHFSKAFKTSVGLTPHGWLQASRVDRARDLLRSPDLPFAEIAIACGFADQSHFTRVFKRATGSTPGAWRRSRQGRTSRD